MFKSLDSIASVVGFLCTWQFKQIKQVLRSQKGLDYNTDLYTLKTKVLIQHFKEFGQWQLIVQLDLTFKSVELTLIKLDLC